MPRPLTAKREHFAQLVAGGSNQSDAYRQAFDVSPSTSSKSVWELGSHLANNDKVSARIQVLREATEAALADKRLWDIERLIDAAEENLHGARGSKQWASANGALELIGRVTGLLDQARNQGQAPVVITRITVVLDHGPDAAGNPQVVEATEYRELGSLGSGEEAIPEPREEESDGT